MTDDDRWGTADDHVYEDIVKAKQEIQAHSYWAGDIGIPFYARDVQVAWNDAKESALVRLYDEAKWWQFRLRWHRWRYNRKLKKFAKQLDREMYWGYDNEGGDLP